MDIETIGKYHQTLCTLLRASKGECGLSFPSEAVWRWQDLCLMVFSVDMVVSSRPRYFAILAAMEYLPAGTFVELRRQLVTVLQRSGVPKVGLVSKNPLVVGGSLSRLKQIVLRWGIALEQLLFAGGSAPSASLWGTPPTDSEAQSILTSVQCHLSVVADCGGYDKRRFSNRRGLLEALSLPASSTLSSKRSSRPGASRKVVTPLWSCSRTLLCAKDLTAAVASGESHFLVEQYRISPQNFDTLSGNDAISAVMKCLPMPLVSASTDPLHFAPFRPIVDALTALRSGKGGRSSLSYGQSSLVGNFPSVLTPDGKCLGAEFVSCYLRHRPLPPSTSQDTMQSLLPQSSRTPHDLSASTTDSIALEAALGQILRFLCKVLHFVHDRFPMTHFYAMLPVLNDALRVMHLLGVDIGAVVTVATNCGEAHSPPAPLQGATLNNVDFGLGDDGASDGWIDTATTHPICQLASRVVFLICSCYHRLQDKIRAAVETSLVGCYSNGNVMGGAVKAIVAEYSDCQTYIDTFALRATQVSLTRDVDSDDEDTFDDAGSARYNRRAIRREDTALTSPPEGSGVGVNLIAAVLHPLVTFSMILPDPGAAVVGHRLKSTHPDSGGFDVSFSGFGSSVNTPRADSSVNLGEGQRHRIPTEVVPSCAQARLHVATLLFAHSVIMKELENVIHFRAPSYLNVYHGVAAQLVKGSSDKATKLFEMRPTKPQPLSNPVQSAKLGEVEWAAVVMSDRRTIERFTDAHPALPLDIKELLLR